MIPISLALQNCRTFHHLEISIPDGLTAIIGQNGAGKSTVINAIDVALFGPESRSLADWYPRDLINEQPLQITLVFEHGGETYRVRRSFSPKGRGASKTDLEREVEEMGLIPQRGDHEDDEQPFRRWEPLTVESQRSTQEQIEELLGLTRDTFRASSFLAQGETGRFCEAPARERKRILAEIVGLADWDRYLDLARREKRMIESNLDKIAGQVEQAEGELQERSLIEQERATAQSEAAETSVSLKDAAVALTTARDALSQAEAKVEHRAEAENGLQRVEQELSKLEAAISEWEHSVRSYDARLAAREKLERTAENLDDLIAEHGELDKASEQWGERERIEAKIATAANESEASKVKSAALKEQAADVLANVGERHCDRCDQILGTDAAKRAAQSYREEAEAAEELAFEREEQISDLSAGLADLPTEEPDMDRMMTVGLLIRDAQQALVALAGLDEVVRSRAQAEKTLAEMRAELPSRQAAAAAARDKLSQFGPHDPDEGTRLFHAHRTAEGRQRDLQDELDRLNGRVARADAQLERLDKIAADLTGARVRRESFQAELAVMTNLEKACGPNGVPALIIENVAVPQIEVEASRILGRLGGPAHAVELRTLREKKTGGISDTLDIVCLTHNGEAPYETFSGGEQARIAFALRLALAQLLASRKGSATGLLVIDELEGLDPDGIAALVDVLEDLQQHVPKIIVVSHQAELRDAFEETIVLENVDGKSEIVEHVNV